MVVAFLVLATGAESQGCGRPHPDFGDAPGWVSGASLLAVNAAVGGVVAATVQAVRGERVVPAFLAGVAGGAVAHAGKRVAASRFDGAGLLGRQVGALGASMVRNGMEGRGLLEEVMLAVGPVRMYVRPASPGGSFRARVDATALAAAVWAIWEPSFRFDPGESLSSGSLVFRVEDRAMRMPWSRTELCGAELSSTILMSRLFPAADDARVFAHERVHVLQSDFVEHVVSDPLVGWLTRDTGLHVATRHVEVNMGEGLFEVAERLLVLPYRQRPLEVEADYMSLR